MWLVVKAFIARWLLGRTLGGMLGVLLALFLPIAGVLKVLGVPLLIALVLLGAPLFLLLAVIGLPLVLVMGVVAVFVALLAPVLIVGVALVKILLPIVLVALALRWIFRKLRNGPPPSPPTMSDAADEEMGHS